MQFRFTRLLATVLYCITTKKAQGFALGLQSNVLGCRNTPTLPIRKKPSPSSRQLSEDANEDVKTNNELPKIENEKLAQTFGGYTVKQRLREEVESPFRKVRLVFFASSTGSALTALYFSFLSALKATMGGYSDAPPLEEALTSCGINVAAVIVCGYLTFTDYKRGEKNLDRIKRGGDLAKLGVSLPDANLTREQGRKTLSDFRRGYRVMICAGGKDRIEEVCRSLCADQLKDKNIIVEKIEEVDTIVIPVLLIPDPNDGGNPVVGDTRRCWMDTVALEGDRNLDATRADAILGFPQGNNAWSEYLKSDVDTASGQGFNVLNKGITVTVKKNGRILNRVTGMPKWGELVGTMNVLDGSKFGMPGDSEKYGGP